MCESIYTHTHTYINTRLLAQSAGAVEYTDCMSAESKALPTSVPDMQLNNLMVRLQNG